MFFIWEGFRFFKEDLSFSESKEVKVIIRVVVDEKRGFMEGFGEFVKDGKWV